MNLLYAITVQKRLTIYKFSVERLLSALVSHHFQMGTWQDKTVVKLSSDDNMHMEGFALGVFAKADKQDRAGRADAYGPVPLLYFGN